MFYINLWITSTFGEKFDHEFESYEDEMELYNKYPNPSATKEEMVNNIIGIFEKAVGLDARFHRIDDFDTVTLSISKWYDKVPRNIFEKLESFFQNVAAKYPASYGSCHLFGDDPPLEMEISTIKMVGKIIQRERDPFFLKYLPKYVEPEK